MPTLAFQADRQTELRQRALSQLGGAARATPSESLSILYGLASSPATAPDALALLHELQVHQVEIDLQDEELRAARGELEARLRRMSELYERAPAACMTVDAGLVLIEINAAGARLLGRDADGLLGCSLATLLTPAGAGALRSLLARVGPGAAPAQGRLALAAGPGAARVVQAVAAADTVEGRCLLVLLEADPGDGGAAQA